MVLNKVRQLIKAHVALLAILSFFAIFYFLLSVVPHMNFRTNAFDLGIFNQALQQYAHGAIGPNTIRNVPYLFADHFEPIMFLFAPLYWLFGSYTLLLVQIIATLFGGLGIYLLIRKETKNEVVALVATALFLLFFGIITALAFDYHNNVIGTMLIPWLFYCISMRKTKLYYIILALFLFSKENMALISAFLGITLLLVPEKYDKKHGFITLAVSIIFFLCALELIKYLNHSAYDHWPYTALGNSPLEALYFIVMHPIKTLQLLFNDPIKIKMWLLIFASGGFPALFQPRYFLLIIPVIAQKFFSDIQAFWAYSFHYSVELAPPIVIGAALTIAHMKKKSWQHGALALIVILNLLIVSKISLYNGEKVSRIFTKAYYETPYPKASLRTALEIVRNATSVSAQNTIVSHLTNQKIYLLPEVADAEYVIFNLNDTNIWPFKNFDELKVVLDTIRKNQHYSVAYESAGVYVFAKRL